MARVIELSKADLNTPIKDEELKASLNYLREEGGNEWWLVRTDYRSGTTLFSKGCKKTVWSLYKLFDEGRSTYLPVLEGSSREEMVAMLTGLRKGIIHGRSMERIECLTIS